MNSDYGSDSKFQFRLSVSKCINVCECETQLYCAAIAPNDRGLNVFLRNI